MFRQIRHRIKDLCRGLCHLLFRKSYDRNSFRRLSFDEPFSLTGVDRLLMMVHNDLYRKALTETTSGNMSHGRLAARPLQGQ